MGRRVKVWITEAQCVDCAGIYEIDQLRPWQQRCKPCAKANRKRIKRINRVQYISFIIFPLGILMYFLWRDSKPYLAKPALEAALIPIYILSGIILLALVLMLNWY